MEEKCLKELEALYTYYGLNHLLGGLHTILLRKWAAIKDDAMLRDSAADLERELARLKQTQVP